MVCSSRWVILSLDDQAGSFLQRDYGPSCFSTIRHRSERFSKQIKKMSVIYRQLTDHFHMTSQESHCAPKVGNTIQFGRLGSGNNHIQPPPPQHTVFRIFRLRRP